MEYIHVIIKDKGKLKTMSFKKNLKDVYIGDKM